MTVNEYVTMDLILPLAGGLAGAALYHLLGPMLRGCIAAARFASFLCGWAIEAASQRENARAFAWDVVYGKEPASQPFDRLRSVESELVGLACHAAKVNVRITALEERMGKVEEPIDAKEAWFRDATQRVARNTCIGSVSHGSHAGIGRMTYQQWREFVEAHGTLCDADDGIPVYTPYSSGRPCPKPTKDLRPGDEVSVSVKVGAVRLSRLYNSEGREETVFSLDAPTSVRADALDKLRTDNK